MLRRLLILTPSKTVAFYFAGMFVCPVVTSVCCGRTADSVEMPLRVVGPVDARNDVFDGGPNPPWKWTNFGGK